MDTGGNGHPQADAAGLDQQGHRLTGMAHDERSLGVAVRFLVQAFDPWHLAALLGAFEAVHQRHGAAVPAHQAPAQQEADGLEPSRGQGVQGQRRRMEEVKQAVIGAVGQAQAADQAGDARQVRAEAEGGQDHR